jgi:hypothetical protein
VLNPHLELPEYRRQVLPADVIGSLEAESPGIGRSKASSDAFCFTFRERINVCFVVLLFLTLILLPFFLYP